MKVANMSRDPWWCFNYFFLLSKTTLYYIPPYNMNSKWEIIASRLNIPHILNLEKSYDLMYYVKVVRYFTIGIKK